MRGTMSFHLKTPDTAGALSAGRIGIPATPGTDAAPSDDSWWSKRTPPMMVRRSSEIVSVTNALKYLAVVTAW